MLSIGNIAIHTPNFWGSPQRKKHPDRGGRRKGGVAQKSPPERACLDLGESGVYLFDLCLERLFDALFASEVPLCVHAFALLNLSNQPGVFLSRLLDFPIGHRAARYGVFFLDAFDQRYFVYRDAVPIFIVH